MKDFVAVEQAVPAGEQIAFKPAFALMLAQHLHDPAIAGEKFVVGLGPCVPLPIGDLEHGVQAVGQRLVGAKDTEIALGAIEFDHIAQEDAKLVRVGCGHGPG